MARLLAAVLVLVAALALVAGLEPAIANHTYRGPTKSTGYAYGSITGASSGTLNQGHFANHSTAWCPGDPAAAWPYGTSIWGISPQPSYTGGSGQTVVYTTQTLKDIGDSSCNWPNYWVDHYFGRWKYTSLACSCNNATEVCWTTSSFVNNCGNAVTWGVAYPMYYTSSQ